ncbi:MAG: divalent cation transporter [bacterium]|nr:divalent cation transporter [bacterium]
MNDFVEALIYAALAGVSIPVGGVLARFESIQPRWLETEFRHGVIAFGGGALMAAVALVLVPEGIERLSIPAVCASFLAGGAVFMAIDMLLSKTGGAASQLCAMLLDYVPEAMALGAAMAEGGGAGRLLAFLIAIQNVPEAFNAYREMRASGGLRSRTILIAFCLLVGLGPLAAWIGWSVLAGWSAALGVIMVFSSGGILYLVFEDIAPQAKLERRWAPPFGAVCGFLLGMAGHMLLMSVK